MSLSKSKTCLFLLFLMLSLSGFMYLDDSVVNRHAASSILIFFFIIIDIEASTYNKQMGS